MLRLIKKIKKHVIFKTAVFLFIQLVFCGDSSAVFVNKNNSCPGADNLAPRVNLQTADFTNILNLYYSSKKTGLIPKEEHGFIEAEKEIDFFDLSAEFSQANSEKEAILLLKEAVMALGFKGITINIVGKSKDKKAILYRNVFREGMKGNELSIEWRKLLPADEKSINISTSTLEKPYIYIENRDKSPHVYAPWLLKDVFLYRFGSASRISKTVSKFIDYLCIFNSWPAYLGLKLVEFQRPFWLKRVNESLNIAILDRHGHALGQILINNWIGGEPLFADAAEKKEKLKKLTAITHQASLALQYVKYKNKLSIGKITISDTIDGLHQLEKIAQIYRQNNRVIHSSKNRLAVIPGMINLIRKKSVGQKEFHTKILSFGNSINEIAETLEKTHLIENFEVRDTEDRLRKLEDILQNPDYLISAKEDSKQRQGSLPVTQPEDTEIAGIWGALSRQLLQASTIKEIGKLHTKAQKLFRENPSLLVKEENLYHLAKLCLQSEKQYKIQRILEDNLSVIQTFISVYKPLLLEVIKLVDGIKSIYESHEITQFKHFFEGVFKEAEKLASLNNEYFSLVDDSETYIRSLDIKTYNISGLAQEYISRHIDGLADEIEKAPGIEYSFKFEISEDLYAKTDELEFELIMENLLLNAVKYSPKGGLITLAAESAKIEDQDMVAVSITDEGIGIEPSKLDLIGTKYQRLGMEHTGIKGSGLGMSYVKEILEKMNGRMKVSSEGKNKGSKFTVYLPAASRKEVNMRDIPSPNQISPYPIQPDNTIKNRSKSIACFQRLFYQSI